MNVNQAKDQVATAVAFNTVHHIESLGNVPTLIPTTRAVLTKNRQAVRVLEMEREYFRTLHNLLFDPLYKIIDQYNLRPYLYGDD